MLSPIDAAAVGAPEPGLRDHMPYRAPPWTQVVAHRGNSGPLPENTRIAIESAIKVPVDMVEVDIRMTKDGVPVLMHAAEVDLTTSGSGPVEDLTWDEIRTLDAGSWRDPRFAGQRVLSVGEVLDLCRGRVALNLDAQTRAAVEPVTAAVIEAGLTDDVVITGCAAECVEMVASLDANITTLFNPNELLEGVEPAQAGNVVRHSLDIAKELGAVGINVNHALVDADLIARATEVGVAVWAYVIDDEVRFGELVAMGAASLTTNWPARMHNVARERSAR